MNRRPVRKTYSIDRRQAGSVKVGPVFVNLRCEAMTKKLLPRVAVGGFILIAVLGAALILSSAKPPPPLPNPNGYDDFVKAGCMLTGSAGDPATTSLEDLRAEVARNASTLGLARMGLERPCRVPLEYSENFYSRHAGDLAAIKRLAQAFYAEGKLAEREGRDAEAVHAYLENIQLGQESARGGLLIDRLVGLACEAFGCAGLNSVVGQLGAAECRTAIRRLEAMEASDAPGETVEALFQRERAFHRRAYGWRGQFDEVLAFFRFRDLRLVRQQLRQKTEAGQMRLQRLLVDLAARAYERDQGQRPKSVADLVPDYLKAIPQDPMSGTNRANLPQSP